MEAGAAESDWLDLHSEFRPATATYPATNKQTNPKAKNKKTRTNQPTNQTNTEKVPRGWRGSSLWEEYIHLAGINSGVCSSTERKKKREGEEEEEKGEGRQKEERKKSCESWV